MDFETALERIYDSNKENVLLVKVLISNLILTASIYVHKLNHKNSFFIGDFEAEEIANYFRTNEFKLIGRFLNGELMKNTDQRIAYSLMSTVNFFHESSTDSIELGCLFRNMKEIRYLLHHFEKELTELKSER